MTQASSILSSSSSTPSGAALSAAIAAAATTAAILWCDDKRAIEFQMGTLVEIGQGGQEYGKILSKDSVAT